MKKIIVVFLLLVLFLVLLFGIYIAGFKYCFSSKRTIKHSKEIIKTAFQRESNISKIKISPFGSININTFAMSAQGGFDSGTVFSLNSLSSKIEILKLFSRELVISNMDIKGVNVHLNYENNRKFNYSNFFSNARSIFMHKVKKHGFLKRGEINSILIEDSNVDLKTDYGLMRFKNLVLKSGRFNLEEPFTGSINFIFEWRGINANVSASFRYDGEKRIIFVENVLCEEFSLSADGKIILLDTGFVDVEYVLKVNKKLYEGIIRDIMGFVPDGIISKSLYDIDEEIIIYYPDNKNKK